VPESFPNDLCRLVGCGLTCESVSVSIFCSLLRVHIVHGTLWWVGKSGCETATRREIIGKEKRVVRSFVALSNGKCSGHSLNAFVGALVHIESGSKRGTEALCIVGTS
jgi:hypothetical protein